MSSPSVVRWLKSLTLAQNYQCEGEETEVVSVRSEESDLSSLEDALPDIRESSDDDFQQVQDEEEPALPQLSVLEVRKELSSLANNAAAIRTQAQAASFPPVIAHSYKVAMPANGTTSANAGAPNSTQATPKPTKARSAPRRSRASGVRVEAKAINPQDAAQNIVNRNNVLEKRVADLERQLSDLHSTKVELKTAKQELEHLYVERKKDRASLRSAQEETERQKILVFREQERRKIVQERLDELKAERKEQNEGCKMKGATVELHIPIRSDEICAPILCFPETQVYRQCFENEAHRVRCHHLRISVHNDEFNVARSTNSIVNIQAPEEDPMPPAKRSRLSQVNNDKN